MHQEVKIHLQGHCLGAVFLLKPILQWIAAIITPYISFYNGMSTYPAHQILKKKKQQLHKFKNLQF